MMKSELLNCKLNACYPTEQQSFNHHIELLIAWSTAALAYDHIP